MSEWVDFGLYALQAVLLWIALPRWGARFLRPLLDDDSGRMPTRGGWVKPLQAWGLLSVLVLLAYRLDRVPAPLSAAGLHRSGWEALLMTSNLLLALGLAMAGLGAWSFIRGLKAPIPVGGEQAERPMLTRDAFLPRRLQQLVHALLLAALAARPLAGFMRPDLVHAIWGNFVTGLVMALLLFFVTAGSVARAPNHFDRALGGRYRRLEVRIGYLLMANLALLQMAGLALELAGLASRRSSALLVAAFVSVTLGGVMLLPSREAPRRAAPD